MTEVRRHRATILKQAPSSPMTKVGTFYVDVIHNLKSSPLLTLTWLCIINIGVSGVMPISCKLTQVGP